MSDAESQLVSDLLERYARALEHGSQSEQLVECHNTLRLADAALDKVSLNAEHPAHPTQIVILGPTQAGKSTLCNLLLDTDVAGISALAGFTVHAQGFATIQNPAALAPLETLMQPHIRVQAHELDNNNLNQYLLHSVSTGEHCLVQHAVVWDTPDFDSIESSGYRSAVLQAAAIADVLILMVSKDKYADKTVWDMLHLVRRLGKPLLVCINKLDEQDEETVVQSFQRRHTEQFNDDAPNIIALPFVGKNKGTNRDATVSMDARSVSNLNTFIDQASSQVNRSSHAEFVQGFIAHHLTHWMAPINLEQDSLNDWQQTVDSAIANAKQLYSSRYLDNPKKYDTFNKAIAELLTLLEIPGLAGTLTRTRKLVTWPARKLLGIGKHAVNRQLPPPDQELEVLELTLEQTLTSVQGHILSEQQNTPDAVVFWSSLQSEFSNSKDGLREAYLTRAKQLQSEFEPRIDEAAKKLYEQLQDQPALLNTLRAARVSADAAAVVLAVKSGGLAAADLIIAPAMLSVTTLLTESVLGQYMEREKNSLKAEQQALTNEQLIEQTLATWLYSLPDRLNNQQLLLAGHEPLPSSRNNSLN